MQYNNSTSPMLHLNKNICYDHKNEKKYNITYRHIYISSISYY